MEEEAKIYTDFTIVNLNIIDQAKAATLHVRCTYEHMACTTMIQWITRYTVMSVRDHRFWYFHGLEPLSPTN